MTVKRWRRVNHTLAIVDKGGGEVETEFARLKAEGCVEISAQQERGKPIWHLEGVEFRREEQ